MTPGSRRWAPSRFARAFRAVAIPRLRLEIAFVAIDVAVGRLTWDGGLALLHGIARDHQSDNLEAEAQEALADWLVTHLLVELVKVEPIVRRMRGLSWADLRRECRQ